MKINKGFKVACPAYLEAEKVAESRKKIGNGFSTSPPRP